MADIKTKDSLKGTIKQIDKAAIVGDRMRTAYISTKEKAEHSIEATENSPEEYASDRIENALGRGEQETVQQFDNVGRKGVEATKQNMTKAKDEIRNIREHQTEQIDRPQIQANRSTMRSTESPINRYFNLTGTQERATNNPKSEVITAHNKTETLSAQKNNGALPIQAEKRTVSMQPKAETIRTQQAETTIKQSAQSMGNKSIKTAQKTTVKTTQKSVKTAEKTAKTTIKTSQQTAKAAQKTAQASAKATQKAAQAAKATAKAVVAGVKAAVKATIETVKAIIAGTKALVAAIAAGGWVAVVIIILICLIALICGSVFGIFFSGEESGTGQTMRTAVQEINLEYENKLSENKGQFTYDTLEMSGSRAIWKDVLAVYSVKTNTDSDNPQEVATMDDSKLQLLKDIFWEMNAISSRTETKTEKEITETDDGHGNIVQTENMVTKTYLYITVSHKTIDEMATQYGFNQEQKNYLNDLLDDENNPLWNSVLYGISTSDGEIVNVALSQIGNVGGQPYWTWYGFNSHVEWCACFVSWCAEQCGYIDTGVIPKYSSCKIGIDWFKEHGQWAGNEITPEPGTIIFFDWERDGEADHTGIVEKVENGRVYTIEGNAGNSCRENSYPIGYYEIFGYGCPAY